MSRVRTAGTLLAIATTAFGLLTAAHAPAAVIESGPLRAITGESPWHVSFVQRRGKITLSEHRGRGPGPTGSLGFRIGDTWHHASGVTSVEQSEDTRGNSSYRAVLTTSDPGRRRIRVSIADGRRGVISVRARVSGGPVDAMGIAFRARRGERYLGFGERSNAVDQRGNVVENYVGEGAYQPGEYAAVSLFVPKWSIHDRRDATYFPMPWLLSTRGYGVLLGNTQTSYFRLGADDPGAWSVEAHASRLNFRVFAGPRTRDVLRRLTRFTGRQPEPEAPWFLGPWFQTGHDNTEPEERQHAQELRAADAPVSVAETHMRYLPCGGHQGQEAQERDRTRWFHRQGFAILTYFQEKICTDYQPAYNRAVAMDALIERPNGEDYEYDAYAGDRTPPSAEIAQIDFTARRGPAFFNTLLREAYANGYDGWMEDFGEATPPDSVAANGQRGGAHHNFYPVPYHRAGWNFARRQRRPLGRFIRSGWTGVHPYAQIVWGGDPSAAWGFDGLQSAIYNGLTMGLSGIGIWGSDIGGFHSLGLTRLTPELLIRWIQFGAVSPIMRTKSEGIEVPEYDRPQIWDPEILPHWRRYAKLHTQLYPYLVAAIERYREAGIPVMRHLALTHPRDPRAARQDDQYLFGPDLLVAPVTAPDQREQTIYLPRGRWINLWEALAYDPRTGGLRMKRARIVRGRREVTIPAPLGELPGFIRAGALLELLPPDVDTLSQYGGRGLVHLRDRRGRILLLFPRGTSHREFGVSSFVTSRERRGSVSFDIFNWVRRRYRIQASMSTLKRPFRPCRVTVDSRRLPREEWSFNRRTRVLSVEARDDRLLVEAFACRSG